MGYIYIYIYIYIFAHLGASLEKITDELKQMIDMID